MVLGTRRFLEGNETSERQGQGQIGRGARVVDGV